MKIQVLRKVDYEDTNIYVLQFGQIFQYLFPWDGEIFQDYITLKPDLYNRILYWLHLAPLYTREQVEDGEQIVLSGAMKSIDKLIHEGARTRQFKRKQKEAKAEKKSKPCQWQTRQVPYKDKEGTIREEPFYCCLTHGKVVKLKDGEKPSHK